MSVDESGILIEIFDAKLVEVHEVTEVQTPDMHSDVADHGFPGRTL